MPLREDPTYHVGGLTKNDLSLLLAPLPTLPILSFFLNKMLALLSSRSDSCPSPPSKQTAAYGYGGSDTGAPSKGAGRLAGPRGVRGAGPPGY